MKVQKLFWILLLIYMIMAFSGCQKSNDIHSEHNHSDHETTVDHMVQETKGMHDDNDEGEDHSDPDEHEGINENEGVILSEQGRLLAGIRMVDVSKVQIGKQIEIPGEVGFNEDGLAHITPRYPGVVRDVFVQVGQHVEQGTELAIIESNESLSSYKVLAPISGHIISKHITLGEFKSEDEDMFVIANLNSVWVNCVVYANNIEYIQAGQNISIQAVGSDNFTNGIISYIAPVFDETTRSAIARTVLENENNKWRPGMFIKGFIETSSPEKVPAIQKHAVQIMDNKTVVFVPNGENNFVAREVVVGSSNDKYVELLSGLNVGDKYVLDGAFELKAKIVTSALGGHAGHGH